MKPPHLQQLFRFACGVACTLTLFTIPALLHAAEPIKLNVGIPTPQGVITTVQDLPEYITSFFQFAIILLAIILTASMVIAGGIYVASAGFPARIEFAKGLIKRTALALLTLLFAVTLITLINPALLNLELSKSLETVVGERLCQELTTEESCKSQSSCFFLRGACVETKLLTCPDFVDKPQCEDRKCLWFENRCVTQKPPQAAACITAQTEADCGPRIGCVWDAGCDLKPEHANMANTARDSQNPCLDFATKTTCEEGAHKDICMWYEDGKCTEQTIALSRNCKSIAKTQKECESFYACWWTGGSCANIRNPYASCAVSRQCGKDAFCEKDSRTCQPKLLFGQICNGIALDDDDLACKAGYTCKELNNQLLEGDMDTCVDAK